MTLQELLNERNVTWFIQTQGRSILLTNNHWGNNKTPEWMWTRAQQQQWLHVIVVNYLSSSWLTLFAWSHTNISCVLFRDLKTSVWTECFCTSCRKTNSSQEVQPTNQRLFRPAEFYGAKPRKRAGETFKGCLTSVIVILIASINQQK